MAKRKGLPTPRVNSTLKLEPLFPSEAYTVTRKAKGAPHITEMEKTARDMAIRLGPDHPEVKRLRKEIADRTGKSA